MTDYAELRAALDVGPTPGPWFVHGSQGYAVATVGKIRIAADELHIKIRPEDDAAYIAACSPDVIRTLLAERDALEVATKEAAEVIVDRNDEIRRLREALRWAAGTLQAACGLAGPISESSPFKLGDETRTVAQICDAADAALAQGQGERDAA